MQATCVPLSLNTAAIRWMFEYLQHSLASKVLPGYGPYGTLRVLSNESEEYEYHEESADMEDGAEYGRGKRRKRRKISHMQYHDFWSH